MLAVDTNVVVRYLVHDHPDQSAKARRLVDDNETFVPTTVLLDAEWVLRSIYRLSREAAVERLRAFAGLPRTRLEAPSVAMRAFEWAQAGLDFADALHLASAEGCEAFVSFDRRFERRAREIAGASVRQP